MKPDTFYRKYANLPLPKRGIKVDVKMPDGNYQGISPQECYIEISKLQDEIGSAVGELTKWMGIAEKVLH